MFCSHWVYLYVSNDSQNKQALFSYAAFTNWSFHWWCLMFSLRKTHVSRLQIFLMFIIVFWDILPCKMTVDRRFRVTHPWWWRQYAPLKRRSTIILHGITSQKTTPNIILAAVRTWNLTNIFVCTNNAWLPEKVFIRFFIIGNNNFNSWLMQSGCNYCSRVPWPLLNRL
jgi:hypothetical protein